MISPRQAIVAELSAREAELGEAEAQMKALKARISILARKTRILRDELRLFDGDEKAPLVIRILRELVAEPTHRLRIAELAKRVGSTKNAVGVCIHKGKIADSSLARARAFPRCFARSARSHDQCGLSYPQCRLNASLRH
jgi:hypothetical protein